MEEFKKEKQYSAILCWLCSINWLNYAGLLRRLIEANELRSSQGQERPHSPRLVTGVCFKEAAVYEQPQVRNSKLSQSERTTELMYPYSLPLHPFPSLK